MTTTKTMPAPTKGELAGMTIYGQIFAVTSVSFDWEMDEEEDIPSDEDKQAIINQVLEGEWVVATSEPDWDEEAYATELQEQIEGETGWLVDTLDYRFVVTD